MLAIAGQTRAFDRLDRDDKQLATAVRIDEALEAGFLDGPSRTPIAVVHNKMVAVSKNVPYCRAPRRGVVSPAPRAPPLPPAGGARQLSEAHPEGVNPTGRGVYDMSQKRHLDNRGLNSVLHADALPTVCGPDWAGALALVRLTLVRHFERLRV